MQHHCAQWMLLGQLQDEWPCWLALLNVALPRVVFHVARTQPRVHGSLGCLKIFRVGILGAMANPPLDVQASWWDGLCEDWDNTPEVRARLREGNSLLLNNPVLKSEGVVERSIHNCRFNKFVLLPALTRWSANGPEFTPSIDLLFIEVEKLFKVCKRTATVSEMHLDAWALRRLLGLVKAQVSKTHVPQDSWLIQFEKSRILFPCLDPTITWKTFP